MCMYITQHVSLSLSLSMCIYIYIYIYTHITNNTYYLRYHDFFSILSVLLDASTQDSSKGGAVETGCSGLYVIIY